MSIKDKSLKAQDDTASKSFAVDGKKPYDLVLQGGGVRAIALVGAIAELEKQGYSMQRAVGTSAGAIVGSLYAAGYTGDELYNVVKDFNFSKLRDKVL